MSAAWSPEAPKATNPTEAAILFIGLLVIANRKDVSRLHLYLNLANRVKQMLFFFLGKKHRTTSYQRLGLHLESLKGREPSPPNTAPPRQPGMCSLNTVGTPATCGETVIREYDNTYNRSVQAQVDFFEKSFLVGLPRRLRQKNLC